MGATKLETLPQRLWSKVDKSGECWIWQGALQGNGYGTIRRGAKMVPAHRAAWELEVGPIPPGMVLDHRCHTILCVRPGHLRLATRGQNQQHRAGPTRANVSGHRGVTWNKRERKWRAKAQLDGRTYWGGAYDDLSDAAAAATALRAQLFTHADSWHEPKTGV